MLDTLRSGKWNRGTGQTVNRFEEAYAKLTGTQYCLATANGTASLYTSLNALGVEPGDEVIVPPYTFIATVNVVLRQYALPVFVDTDRETMQMDARKLEAAITPATQGNHPGSPRGQRLRSRRDSRDRREAQGSGARGRVPGAPGGMARPQGGVVRAGRLLQLPGIQEPELRRGRRGDLQRRRIAGALPCLP